MADLKFEVDSSEVSRAVDELIRMGTASKTTAKAFEQGFRKVVSWQGKFKVEQGRVNASLEKNYQAQMLANKSARDSAKAFEEAAAASKRLAQTKDELSRKYKPLYASSKLYERTLEEINQANKLGVLTDKQREASIEQLNQEFATGTGVFSTYANGMGKGANRLGVAMQQTGYQVGDFLVQVQSGTNPMVAFGQQATQLVGIMYLLPTATLAASRSIMGLNISLAGVTLGLSIIIPLITAAGAAWMRTSSEAKEASNAVDEYEESFKSLTRTLKDYRTEQEAISAGFSDVQEFTLTQALEKSRDSLKGLEAELTELEGQLKDVYTPDGGFVRVTGPIQEVLEARQGVADLQKIILEREEALAALQGKNADAANKTVDALKEELELKRLELRYGTDSAYVAKLRAEQEAKSKGLVGEAAEKYVEVLLSLQATQKVIDEVVKPVEKLREELGDAAVNALKLAGVDMTSGISKAEEAAAKLAAKLGLSFEMASKILAMGEPKDYSKGVTFDPRDPDYDPEAARLARISQRMKDGSGGYFGGGGSTLGDVGGGAAASNLLADLQAQLDLEQELIGKSEEYIRVRQSLGDTYANTNASVISSLEQQVVAINAAKEAEQERQQLMQTVESSLESGFMAMIDGTKSVKDAFKDMARQIIAELYRVLVVKRLVSNITSALGFADGGVFSGGSQVKAFADGGVVGGPTFFPMSGGQTGLMGEAGPEAIMPLKRGANGKLGVQAEGNGGGTVNITQNFSFSANGDDSVKKIIAQAAPQIAQMTKSSILDDRRRGGQMKSVFG